MAFKIAASGSRPKKLAKCISAFDADDDDFSTVSTAKDDSVAGPSSTADEAAAAKWVEKGSNFAEQGDNSAALRCWDQALLVRANSSCNSWAQHQSLSVRQFMLIPRC
jgi:hypothetical protein